MHTRWADQDIQVEDLHQMACVSLAECRIGDYEYYLETSQTVYLYRGCCSLFLKNILGYFLAMTGVGCCSPFCRNVHRLIDD